MRRRWIIALLLAVATLALYWPVRHFDLVLFDDPVLLTDNPDVKSGLNWTSVKWAFSSVVIANWQPVTNFSFLLISQFFGIAPGAHHLVNAALHAANAGLVFLLLWRLTHSTWRSAAVAAIFAWHPLRVESVAWIAERKDVLCAFFFLLALLLYTCFAHEPKITSVPPGDSAARNLKSRVFYGASLFAFVLALLSKPMAVTLPFVLLLLDAWPLGRLQISNFQFLTFKKLLWEKAPFFVLMITFCLTTYRIQHDYAAMTPWEQLSLAPRMANAISSYLAYLGQLVWPVHLAVIYPYPKSFDPAQIVLKVALLLAISAGCVMQFTRRPWLAVGWFWYLGTAFPVIGLVQVGSQAMADRYTYLPLLGPVVAIVWTTAEFVPKVWGGKVLAAAMSIGVACTLVFLSARQLQFWQNTVTLFEHNVAVTPGNSMAEFTLGVGFERAGDTNQAIVCYRVVKMIAPYDFQNRRNLANLLTKTGQFDAAETEYRSLLADEPAEYLNHLGLAGLFAAQGRIPESVLELDKTLSSSPDCVEALNNLAWTLATSARVDIRDGSRAVGLAQHACELTDFNQTIYIGTLAAAQAQAGEFDDAVATAQRACEVAKKNGETSLLQNNQKLLELYRAHKTVTEK